MQLPGAPWTADLCGGHSADVLIAVCLAAQTLTMPVMGRGGRAGGDGAELPRWPRLKTEGLGVMRVTVCVLKHACLSLVSTRRGWRSVR